MTAKEAICAGLVAALCLAFPLAGGEAGERPPHATYAQAAEGKGYGAKKPVATAKEARRALEEHFEGRDVKVGKIEERELFFEAEILDRRGRLADKVIVDKRTGRIRSIY
ncbi:MAG: hypothetical protein PVJ36_08005 [Nitrospirota bacterium]|jgi:hypothetical protein